MSLTMDDRDGLIWLDGGLTQWRDARMHVLTHALHYGSAVFEGERIYDGKIFRLAAHSQRLINSARLLDYEIPWTRIGVTSGWEMARSRLLCDRRRMAKCYRYRSSTNGESPSSDPISKRLSIRTMPAEVSRAKERTLSPRIEVR